MIFRQLFDATSGTYTYLLASRHGGEALIIDPVLEKVDRYLKLMEELDLKLVKAVDTHLHADHITGLGALRDRTRCVTVMGEQSKVDVVSMRIADGDKHEILHQIDGLQMRPDQLEIIRAERRQKPVRRTRSRIQSHLLPYRQNRSLGITLLHPDEHEPRTFRWQG